MVVNPGKRKNRIAATTPGNGIGDFQADRGRK
jgi:hypothetical protein